jgi:hypothetical protein
MSSLIPDASRQVRIEYPESKSRCRSDVGINVAISPATLLFPGLGKKCRGFRVREMKSGQINTEFSPHQQIHGRTALTGERPMLILLENIR